MQFTGDTSATLLDARCEIAWGDEAGNQMVCDDGESYSFALQSRSLGGADQDLLVLMGHVWYRVCGDGTLDLGIN